MAAIVARRQGHARFEALKLDPRARASPQQPISRLPQPNAALRRVTGKGGIKGCEKCCNISFNPFTQRLIDERRAFFDPLRLGYHLGRRAVAGRRILAAPLPTSLSKTLVTSRRTRCDSLAGNIGSVPTVILRVGFRGYVIGVGQGQM